MKALLLSVVVGLQMAWVLGTSVYQENLRSSGTVVLFETAPVDPRDFLRGDYVILGYKFSTLHGSQFNPPLTKAPVVGSYVYVTLSRNGDRWEAAGSSLTPPATAPGDLVLRGQVEHAFDDGAIGDRHNRAPGANILLRVNYGLERFYVREGTGNPQGKLTVEAAVTASGQATIRQLFLNGRPYAEAMKSTAR